MRNLVIDRIKELSYHLQGDVLEDENWNLYSNVELLNRLSYLILYFSDDKRFEIY